MERQQPRTWLEQLVCSGDQTLKEVCDDFSRCAEGLKVDATLSTRQLTRWMAGQVESARPGARRVAKELWGHPLTELLKPPPHLNGSRAAAVALTDEVLRDMAVRAPAQPSATAQVATDEEMMLAANESASFARRAQPVLSSEMLAQMEADVRQFAIDYLASRPYAMIRPIANFRRDVFDIIERHPKVAYLPRLYSFAGQASALLALASSDLGQGNAADNHARTAWLCSDLADLDAGRPFIRWVQSQVAYWRHDFASAAELADSGVQFAKDASSKLRLMSQKTRALAALGDKRAVVDAVAGAVSIRDSAVSDSVLDTGVFLFSAGKAAYYASEAWYSLGGRANLSQAVAEASESIKLFESSPVGRSPEQVAAARIDLALARIAMGDLDGSEESLRPVIDLHSDRRTLPIVKRMGSVRKILTAGSLAESRLAIDLCEEIDLFNAYPATRELPLAIG